MKYNMPYISDKKGIIIPRDLRKTVKIPLEDHENIKLHYLKSRSQRKTATHFGVSRKLIQFIISPERLARHKELAKERRLDGRYYNKEKHAEYMRKYRKNKQKLFNEGKLDKTQ